MEIIQQLIGLHPDSAQDELTELFGRLDQLEIVVVEEIEDELVKESLEVLFGILGMKKKRHRDANGRKLEQKGYKKSRDMQSLSFSRMFSEILQAPACRNPEKNLKRIGPHLQKSELVSENEETRRPKHAVSSSDADFGPTIHSGDSDGANISSAESRDTSNRRRWQELRSESSRKISSSAQLQRESWMLEIPKNSGPISALRNLPHFLPRSLVIILILY